MVLDMQPLPSFRSTPHNLHPMFSCPLRPLRLPMRFRNRKLSAIIHYNAILSYILAQPSWIKRRGMNLVGQV